jgi:DNA-binding NarL/FixJ family response regulator
MVRVVVVDDQPVGRRLLRAVVESADGFELAGELADGESALEHLDLLGPDLVLMDVRMPGLGGIETARRLTERRPTVAVVLCSASPPATGEAPDGLRVLDKSLLDAEALLAVWRITRPG